MSVFEKIIPGSVIREERSDAKADVAHIFFNTGGKYNLLAHVFLPYTAPAEAIPLCGAVFNGDQRIWSFKGEDFDGRVHLLWVRDTAVLAFVGRETRAIERVISLKALSEGDSLGLKASIDFKLGAADLLGMDYVLTDTEGRIFTQTQEKRREKLASQIAAREEEKKADAEARRREREKKISALKGRQQYAVTDGSRNLYGIPVERDEWQILPDGTWCVMVEGYDPETGKCEALIEHFVVSRKKGANATRAAVTCNISFKENRQIDPPEAVKKVLVEIDDDFYEVPLYTSAADIELLKKLKIAGLWAVQASDGLAIGKISVSSEGNVEIFKVAGVSEPVA